MYRRVVLSKSTATSGSDNITVLYHVRGAIPLAQYRRYDGNYNTSVPFGQQYFPVVFDDAIKLGISGTLKDRMSYEFILDADENQPAIESVEEVSREGITITVYNADGVIVCRNNGGISAGIDSAQTEGPGEMTSEPIEGPGEMTSEPIGAPGEMTSVPGEEPGEMTGETTGDPGAMI